MKGAIYHVMDRGNRLEEIYRDVRDREIFLKTLGEVSERCGWQVCNASIKSRETGGVGIRN